MASESDLLRKISEIEKGLTTDIDSILSTMKEYQKKTGAMCLVPSNVKTTKGYNMSRANEVSEKLDEAINTIDLNDIAATLIKMGWKKSTTKEDLKGGVVYLQFKNKKGIDKVYLTHGTKTIAMAYFDDKGKKIVVKETQEDATGTRPAKTVAIRFHNGITSWLEK